MSDHKSKHPLFLIIAYLAIAGGLSVLLMSLYLLTSTIEKQRWPVTDITPAQSGLFYQLVKNVMSSKRPTCAGTMPSTRFTITLIALNNT